ncbi:MAG: hypothetical protein L3J71_10670 [Victivallaceae bacterium]|nr:hypothetical protein [Victivallaceae bacterium]
MFIAGPFAFPAKCKRIIDTLQEVCGEGNSHFIMPSDAMEFDEAEGRWEGSEIFTD